MKTIVKKNTVLFSIWYYLYRRKTGTTLPWFNKNILFLNKERFGVFYDKRSKRKNSRNRS
jgi:hypothetical protein